MLKDRFDASNLHLTDRETATGIEKALHIAQTQLAAGEREKAELRREKMALHAEVAVARARAEAAEARAVELMRRTSVVVVAEGDAREAEVSAAAAAATNVVALPVPTHTALHTALPVPTHTAAAPHVPTHTSAAPSQPTIDSNTGIMRRDAAVTSTVEGIHATDLFIDSMRDGAGGTRLPAFGAGRKGNNEKARTVLCINFFRGVATAEEEREILMSTQSDAGEQRILTEKLHDLVVLRLKQDYERAGKVPPSLKFKRGAPKPRLKVKQRRGPQEEDRQVVVRAATRPQ